MADSNCSGFLFPESITCSDMNSAFAGYQTMNANACLDIDTANTNSLLFTCACADHSQSPQLLVYDKQSCQGEAWMTFTEFGSCLEGDGADVTGSVKFVCAKGGASSQTKGGAATSAGLLPASSSTSSQIFSTNLHVSSYVTGTSTNTAPVSTTVSASSGGGSSGDRTDLLVGLGVGIPSLVIAALGVWIAYKYRVRQPDASKADSTHSG